jgi:hypothetical protein
MRVAIIMVVSVISITMIFLRIIPLFFSELDFMRADSMDFNLAYISVLPFMCKLALTFILLVRCAINRLGCSKKAGTDVQKPVILHKYGKYKLILNFYSEFSGWVG